MDRPLDPQIQQCSPQEQFTIFGTIYDAWKKVFVNGWPELILNKIQWLLSIVSWKLSEEGFLCAIWRWEPIRWLIR